MSASFSTRWPAESRDVFPPKRITDFRLASTSNSSLFVGLEWTAPGDDYNSGQAFSYEVRCFTSKAALSEDNYGEQGIPVHSSLVPVPEPQGQPQRCTVSVPWPNEVFYYAIVALDEVGNRGQVSNMVAVFVTEPLTTVAPEELVSGYPSMEDVSSRLPLKSFLHSESMVYVIAGIISAILILLVLVLIVIVRHLGGCANKRLATGSNTPAPPSPPPSLPDLCQGPQESEPYSRHSVSYVSGFHLPEMLDYSMIRKASGHHQHFTEVSEHRPRPLSPSVSPVNSTYTTGHSTDCSVSVSGSDHELVTGDVAGLQVVAVTLPRSQLSSELMSSSHLNNELQHTAARHVTELQNAARHVNSKEPPSLPRHPSRPEPKPRKSLHYHNEVVGISEQKPRKTPPAVPNKTVHASLV